MRRPINAASKEIGAVAKIFGDKLDDDGSKQMILGCGVVLASMHQELLVRIFAAYPELEAESRRRALAAFPENT